MERYDGTKIMIDYNDHQWLLPSEDSQPDPLIEVHSTMKYEPLLPKKLNLNLFKTPDLTTNL